MWNPFRKNKVEAIPEFTPDLAILENREEHLLFHYGDEFGHVPQISLGFTDEKMIMWVSKTEQGAAPVALQMHIQTPVDDEGMPIKHLARSIPRGRIGGILYQVTTEEMISLDSQFENGVIFKRKRIKLRLPYDSQTRKGEYRHYTDQRAWAYLGTSDYWEPKIEWDTCFHRGNGTSSFEPADHHISGRAHLSVDSWVHRYYEFHRRPPETVVTKTYIYFKGSSRSQPVEEPFEPPTLPPAPQPADDMRRLANLIEESIKRE